MVKVLTVGGGADRQSYHIATDLRILVGVGLRSDRKVIGRQTLAGAVALWTGQKAIGRRNVGGQGCGRLS